VVVEPDQTVVTQVVVVVVALRVAQPVVVVEQIQAVAVVVVGTHQTEPVDQAVLVLLLSDIQHNYTDPRIIKNAIHKQFKKKL
jgi:hypothetical protein